MWINRKSIELRSFFIFDFKKKYTTLYHPLRTYNIILWIMYGNIQFNTLNLFIFFLCLFWILGKLHFHPKQQKKISEIKKTQNISLWKLRHSFIFLLLLLLLWKSQNKLLSSIDQHFFNSIINESIFFLRNTCLLFNYFFFCFYKLFICNKV